MKSITSRRIARWALVFAAVYSVHHVMHGTPFIIQGAMMVALAIFSLALFGAKMVLTGQIEVEKLMKWGGTAAIAACVPIICLGSRAFSGGHNVSSAIVVVSLGAGFSGLLGFLIAPMLGLFRMASRQIRVK